MGFGYSWVRVVQVSIISVRNSKLLDQHAYIQCFQVSAQSRRLVLIFGASSEGWISDRLEKHRASA